MFPAGKRTLFPQPWREIFYICICFQIWTALMIQSKIWELGVMIYEPRFFKHHFPVFGKENCLQKTKHRQVSLHGGGQCRLVSEVDRLEDWPCFSNC